MRKIIDWANNAQNLLDKTRRVDFLAPLALRLYLAPVFWTTGNNKWNPLDPDSSLQPVIDWFGNPDWGLGLPMPALMAYLAWGAEYFGAILLFFGIATRWISVPLMITMVVAAVTVHWENGWQVIHDPQSPWPSGNIDEATNRLEAARGILREHGDYPWLTEHGELVMLNNGIEWAATYFILLLVLFFIGGGRWVSGDFWLARYFRK